MTAKSLPLKERIRFNMGQSLDVHTQRGWVRCVIQGFHDTAGIFVQSEIPVPLMVKATGEHLREGNHFWINATNSEVLKDKDGVVIGLLCDHPDKERS